MSSSGLAEPVTQHAGVCKECASFHQTVSAIVRELRADDSAVAKDVASKLDIALHFERDEKTVWQNHTACFLCARLWYFLRLKRHQVTGLIMSEAETLEYIQDPERQGQVKFDYNINMHTKKSFVVFLYTEGVDTQLLAYIEPSTEESQEPSPLSKWRPYADEAFAGITVGTRLHEDLGELSDPRAADSASQADQTASLSKFRLDHYRNCLRMCDSSHDCYTVGQEQFDKPFIPPRLLRIDHGTGKIRLVDTDSLDPTKIRYATLSHCWGTLPIKTLTVENLEGAKLDIPRDQLGRTFREAASLCGQFGLSYLWIDSWCIVQNSPDALDWQGHVGCMQGIYERACLNFAAGSSTSCREGLTRTYERHFLQSWFLETGDGMCFKWARKGGMMERLLWQCAPLLRRAWVIQEIFLARRVIIFTDAGMYWKCQQRFFAEPEYPDKESRMQNVTPEQLSHLGAVMANDPYGEQSIDMEWAKRAHGYSGSGLTKPSDRIAAFASLVAFFTDKYTSVLGSPAEYLVGAWKHNAITWLLWRGEKGSIEKRSRFVDLPSWSWLSCSQPVTFLAQSALDMANHMARLVGHEIILEDQGKPYGPLRVARLRLQAPVFTMRLSQEKWQREDTFGDVFLKDRPLDIFCTADYQKFTLEKSATEHLVLPMGSAELDGQTVVSCEPRFDYGRPDGVSTLHCIYLTHATPPSSSCYYLLLVERVGQVEDGDIPEYRRLGIMVVAYGTSHDRRWPPADMDTGSQWRFDFFFNSMKPLFMMSSEEEMLEFTSPTYSELWLQ